MTKIKALVALALVSASPVLADFHFPSLNVKLYPGQNTAVTSFSTGTSVKCQTLLGPIPPILPVITHTLTNFVPDLLGTTVTSTSTPTSTVTPAPLSVTKNLTSLVTSIVQGQVTQVSVLTNTVVSSIVNTITQPLATTTLTIVQTSTTYTSTTTIAASGGFLGVLETGLPTLTSRKRSELAALNLAAKDGPVSDLGERGFFDGWPFSLGGSSSGSSGSSGSSSGGSLLQQLLHGIPGIPNLINRVSIKNSNLYPLQVNCFTSIIVHKIVTVVVLASPARITLPAATVTQTRTVVATITSTRVTGTTTAITTVQTTTTVTSNVTAPQNTFTATTVTTAVLAQVSQFVAACGSKNLLGPALPDLFGATAGDLITDILYDASKVQLVTTPGNTQYDCCSQCIQEDGCTFGGWDPAGICYLHVTKDQTCPAQSAEIGEYLVEAGPVDQEFAVYNGYCGSLAYGGLESNS